MVGRRAGADRGLVPAGPDPHDRRPALRRRRRALRERRRRGQPRLRGLRPDGHPTNPCGDPPVGVGGTQTPPTSEGGALRSQDLRTPADPTTLDGTHPAREPGHRRGAADQPARRRAPIPKPAGSSPTASATRSASRSGPGRDEVWIGDVGWNTTEEINRSPTPPTRPSRTSAGPATRARSRQGGYDAANLNICENLYAAAGRPRPVLRLPPLGQGRPRGHRAPPAARRSPGWPSTRPAARCPRSSTARSSSPTTRADASGSWSAAAAALPSPSRIRWLPAGASMPVDIQFGPGGDLFYADVWGGTIKRIHYTAGNQAPKAVARGHPHERGHAACREFDARGSSDPDGDALTYAWDTRRRRGLRRLRHARSSVGPTARPGVYTVGLKVTDSHGASATDIVAITAGNTPPVATIVVPLHRLHAGRSGRRSRFERQRHRRAGRRPAGERSSAGRSCSTTARRTATRTQLQTFPGIDHGELRRAGPRVPVVPRADAHGHRQRRAHRHPDRSGSTRRRWSSRCARPRAGSKLAVNGAAAAPRRSCAP